MVTIPWRDLSEPAYAQLVSMLLHRMMPDAEVIDGTGGDGGRDIQVRRDGTLTIYELKHFTGRLSARSPKRREQVERSLAQAAKLNPTSWHLVVPINHNPAELQWFDGLRSQRPFVGSWHGLSWLDAQFSEHPDLIRSALNTVNDELLAAIREHRAEQDMLARGIPDYVSRLDVLQARANEISPHYRVQVSETNEGRQISVFAKHDRAAEVAPITLSGRFIFPDDESGRRAQQQFLDAFAFGEDLDLDGKYTGPFTVSGPRELGIDETVQPERMQLLPVPEPVSSPVQATLKVLDTTRCALAEVGLVFTERRLGHSGMVLATTDATGVLAVRVRLDMVNGTAALTLSLRCPERVLPSSLVPALRLFGYCAPPNLMRLELNIGGSPSPIEAAISQTFADDELLHLFDLIERLAMIQDFTRCAFELPQVFTPADMQTIYHASNLIAGEHVTLASKSVKITLTPIRPSFPIELSPDGEFRLALTFENTPITIAGRELDLGRSVRYVRRGRLRNHREVTAGHAPGELVTLDVDLTLGEDFNHALGGLDKVIL